MPESLLEKVAKTNERNSVIVDEYIKNKDVYGKTIIFALMESIVWLWMMSLNVGN